MKQLFAIALVATMAASSQAAYLWDQSSFSGNGVVNQQFADFPTFSAYTVGDITLSQASNITSVSTLIGFAVSPAFISGVNSGVLNIFAKTGSSPLAGDNPAAGTIVSATTTIFDAGNNIYEFKASGLNINLAAGSYWVGLTPDTNFGVHGQAFHVGSTTSLGDASHVRNPGGGFALPSGTSWAPVSTIGTDFDSTLRIEGAPVPEPATMAVLGLGAAALMRRRRKA